MRVDDQALQKLGSKLADAQWRLANLYFVKDKQGRSVRFVPRKGQMKVINAIYRDGLRRLIIPKARQMGISTVIGLIMLDLMLFKSGTQAAIVDMTQADASKKLRGKIVFAFERLPAFLRKCYKPVECSGKSFSLRLKNRADDTIRQIQAGMHARGDTFQFVHISEWGIISFNDPTRSEEIVTGALQAVEQGIVVVETTWKGGKVDHLWETTKKALEMPPEHRTLKDFTVFFCPWWEEDEYTMAGDARQITGDCRKYLEEIEGEIRKEKQDAQDVQQGPGFALTPGQRLWYYKQAWGLGLFRFQEYPSILSECFRAPIEGAIYAELIDQARASGRIGAIEPEPDVVVDTAWDLGGPANIVTWYFQTIGEEIRFIDCDSGLDLTPAARVEWMRAKGYRFRFHYLPHDAYSTKSGGQTVAAGLAEAGLENIRIIPRTDDVWVGINRVRSVLPRMTFRTPHCDRGLNSLEAYRSGIWIDKGRGMDVPVHDKASHAADALRTMGEADLAEMLESGWVRSAFSKEGLAALG